MNNNLQGLFFTGDVNDNYIGHIIQEVYKDRVYEPILKDRKDLTIVEIGANVGIVSYYFSRFAKDVYAVEPSTDNFSALKYMAEFNKLDNVHPIKKAIYTENKELPFFHNKNKTMHSLHMAVDDKSSEPEMVQTVTLEKLFEDEKIEHVDLMKVDCEGSEFEILGHSSFRKVADKVDAIVGETHAWAGRQENQMKDILEARGFKFEWLNTEAKIYIATK